MAGGRRNFGLDALRTVSIIGVLANHALLWNFVVPPEYSMAEVPPGGTRWVGVTAALSDASFLSIEFLFVLSGFLIGTMMIRSFDAAGTFWQRAKDFWLRRWFRTLPLYFVFLGVNALMVAPGIGLGAGKFDWSYALFSQNLYHAEPFPFFYGEAWSLALDEWFYLVLPLLVGLAGLILRLPARMTFVAATATLIAVPTVLRFLAPSVADHGDFPAYLAFDWDIRRVTIYHLDATGFGVLAAVLGRWWNPVWTRAPRAKALAGAVLVAAGVALVESLVFWPALAEAYPRAVVTVALTLPALGTMLMLPWITTWRARKGALGVAVERISLYSYAIYLVHVPLLEATRHVGFSNWHDAAGIRWAVTLVWIVAVGVLAAAVHHAFEKPVSDLRDRFTRKVDANPFAAPPTPHAAPAAPPSPSLPVERQGDGKT